MASRSLGETFEVKPKSQCQMDRLECGTVDHGDRRSDMVRCTEFSSGIRRRMYFVLVQLIIGSQGVEAIAVRSPKTDLSWSKGRWDQQ